MLEDRSGKPLVVTGDHIERLVVLETHMTNVREDMTEIKADIKSIASTLSEAKGGWKTMLAIAGIGGFFGALGHKAALLAGILK